MELLGCELSGGFSAVSEVKHQAARLRAQGLSGVQLIPGEMHLAGLYPDSYLSVFM